MFSNIIPLFKSSFFLNVLLLNASTNDAMNTAIFTITIKITEIYPIRSNSDFSVKKKSPIKIDPKINEIRATVLPSLSFFKYIILF